MKRIRNIPLFLSTLLLGLFFACDQDTEFVEYKPQFVVEGRIENGSYASVLLSLSASFTESMDTINLLSHAVRNAKVVLSDGQRSEILLLKTNNKKIPPYEYVSREIKGEVGKHYYLTIEYYDRLITAETHIPPPVEMDSLWFVKANESDTVGYIHISFKNVSEYNYQLSTQELPDENVFVPCLYGNIDRVVYPANSQVIMQLSKGPVIFPKADYTTHFPDNQPIRVKLSTQTTESFAFWTSYQNEILNSQNPIFPATNRLKSNINGGVGIWAGYGSTTKVIQPDSN